MADPGKKWGQWDYSQQEPRVLVHYAERRDFTDAKKMGDFYRSSREADFYKYVQTVADVVRFEAKTISLGRFYGMGKKKLAMRLGCDLSRAGELLKKYDTHVPFVTELSRDCQAVVKKRGYITTILGRRRHFDTWAPVGEWGMDPLPLKQAQEKWPDSGLERFGTHKALNSLIQGSSADMTKKAMVDMYEGEHYVPYLTVHDEVDGPIEDEEQARKIQAYMEKAVQLSVPLVAEPEIKERWA
jgi:DNA polymerase I-like protein with 3'-5' exonuclease and polymerase domains